MKAAEAAFVPEGDLPLSRHFLFASDPYLGLRAVQAHFLPWVCSMEEVSIETTSRESQFTVRVGNRITGDLEVSLKSGSHIVIPRRRWKYHLFRFIQAPDLRTGFGGSYLLPITSRFFEHLKGDCGCFAPSQKNLLETRTEHVVDLWTVGSKRQLQKGSDNV